LSYQVLADDGTPLDAHFDVDDNTLIFHSRGGTKGKNATNVDYTPGLRLIVQRLTAGGYAVQRAWVDSSRVQAIPIEERLILDVSDAGASPAEQVSRMAARMQAIGRDPTAQSAHGSSTKRIRLQVPATLQRPQVLTLLKSAPAKKDFRSEQRLPTAELDKVTAEHLFNAVQRLLAGADHSFGESTDYDVVLDDGTRLPPKAVFGLAAEQALGHPVIPRHFSAGSGSPCFRILKSANYNIVSKGSLDAPEARDEPADAEWREGSPKLRTHFRRERASGLPAAKKAQFRRLHGRLYCERCGEDPIQKYQTEAAEACIEVHHARVQVSHMQEGHRTPLEDVQCLCANCHRLTHREMRGKETI
jgi:hypothetical protein